MVLRGVKCNSLSRAVENLFPWKEFSSRLSEMVLLSGPLVESRVLTLRKRRGPLPYKDLFLEDSRPFLNIVSRDILPFFIVFFPSI